MELLLLMMMMLMMAMMMLMVVVVLLNPLTLRVAVKKDPRIIALEETHKDLKFRVAEMEMEVVAAREAIDAHREAVRRSEEAHFSLLTSFELFVAVPVLSPSQEFTTQKEFDLSYRLIRLQPEVRADLAVPCSVTDQLLADVEPRTVC